jgi:hypothetical protein
VLKTQGPKNTYLSRHDCRRKLGQIDHGGHIAARRQAIAHIDHLGIVQLAIDENISSRPIRNER